MSQSVEEIAIHLLAQKLTDKDMLDLAEIAILQGDDFREPDEVTKTAYQIMVGEEDYQHPEGRMVKGSIGAIMYLRSKKPNLGLKEAKDYVKEGYLKMAYEADKDNQKERNKMAQLFLEILHARRMGFKVI